MDNQIIQLNDFSSREISYPKRLGEGTAGITDGIKLGKSKLPTLDPFHDIDPLIGHEEEYDLAKAIQNNQNCLSEGLTCVPVSDDEESDYEEGETEKEEEEELSDPRNIFEVLDDEEDL